MKGQTKEGLCLLLIFFHSQKYAVCFYCNLGYMQQFFLQQTRLAEKSVSNTIFFIKEKHFRTFIVFHLCDTMFHNAVFLFAQMCLNVTGSLTQVYLLLL